jgi:hypothetical protein
MHTHFQRLVFLLALSLNSSCWAGCSQALPHSDPTKPTAVSAEEVQLAGELRYYRHIDPVTGQGAVSIYADGKETPLDLREFKPDILLRSGPYVVKGHWGKEKHLIVTAAHPARG